MAENVFVEVLLIVDLRHDFIQALWSKSRICRTILQRADGQALSK